MAEVIAVFGALSSVLQIVDFTAKLARHSHELLTAGTDALRENIETERLAREYEQLGESVNGARTGDVAEGEEVGFTRNKSQSTHELDAIFRLSRNCREEARQLLDDLACLRVEEGLKGFKRVRDGSRKAFRALRKRETIEQRRRRLQEINAQLATALLYEVWARQSDFTWGALAAPNQPLADTKDNVERVILLTERSKIEHVLKALYFAELPRRCDDIPEAYPDTYRWALERDSLGFKSWLTEGSGIFWVVGKAGSGKSTLMKYLIQHPETLSGLHTWASQMPVSLASYYSWYPGTAQQKSTIGLLRTILYQILSDNPSLASTAFPDHQTMSTPDPQQPQWTHKELLRALSALVNSDTSTRLGRKFCLFIDGLDEFSGDHLELISLLKRISQSKLVKVCVSSRPWNAFRNAFEGCVASLRLDELSRPDIEKYVHGSLEDIWDVNDQAYGKLVKEVVDKAEGLFLWVFLVMKSLRRGLAEGDSLQMLRHRVSTFPADLEDFFRDMLARLDSVYVSHTCQVLKLVWLNAQCNTSGLPFLDCWLILQQPRGLADPDFAYQLKTRCLTAGEVSNMVIETQKFLSATCRDLLWLPGATKNADDCKHINAPRVQFSHRTIYDFLSVSDVQDTLNKNTPAHFDRPLIFDLVNLARLNFMMPGDDLCSWDPFFETTTWMASRNPIFWTKAYLTSFTAAASRAKKFMWRDLDLNRVLHHLCAWQEYQYVVDTFDAIVDSGSHLSSYFPLTSLQLMARAALGKHELNPFGLGEVNIDFLRKLADYSLFIYERFEYGPRSTTTWQIFLRKWALSLPGSVSSPDGKHTSRHIWELAKIFLDNRASIEATFCVCPLCPLPSDSPRENHVSYTAAEFLKMQIPRDWLLECTSCATLWDL